MKISLKQPTFYFFRLPNTLQLHVFCDTKMESENVSTTESEMLYPILIIPKKCTRLVTDYEATDNIFIDMNITSRDMEGNDTPIYSGYCNVKFIDSYGVNIQNTQKDTSTDYCVDEQLPIIIADANGQTSYSQSEVWIDPSRSPYVYNHYNTTEQQLYSVCQETDITYEQRNTTYISKKVYNIKEAIRYTVPEEQENKKKQELNMQLSSDRNIYEEDEYECGVFLSHLSEEILNEKENKDKVERKFIDMESENDALKQLMSSDIQSTSKQHKTILFLGQDSHHGQTVQKMAYTDPYLECTGFSGEVENEVVIESKIQNSIVTCNDDVSNNTLPEEAETKKKYQCAKCQQIFENISLFREHMVNHVSSRRRSRSMSDVTFTCVECGKTLKSREKFENHCLGHGDPDLECSKCHKVYASKFSLRAHSKIHSRKFCCDLCSKTFTNKEDMRIHTLKVHEYPCELCSETFTSTEEMRTHLSKMHYACNACEYVAGNYMELADHQDLHVYSKETSDSDLTESLFADLGSDESDIIMNITPSPDCEDWKMEEENVKELDGKMELGIQEKIETEQNADEVIAKVMSSKMFLSSKKRKNRSRKACDVCMKTFDRISDLKRHLIEHIVRSTLAKTPVNDHGNLILHCEVCKLESFAKIDRYKAHLREHAKLTLYQCTFCNKSFSDSSNFSKHKKIHGITYFQCDLCQRKFNSKKMLVQHMEYHNKNSPLHCFYCDKMFHFESMLNKHIKSAHTKECAAKFRCRFCHKYYKSLKEKWDHEWMAHNVRKMIVDCLICGAKFRKYADLRRHCVEIHELDIPPAKKLLKSRKKARHGKIDYCV